jgi:hypothetical protein
MGDAAQWYSACLISTKGNIPREHNGEIQCSTLLFAGSDVLGMATSQNLLTGFLFPTLKPSICEVSFPRVLQI